MRLAAATLVLAACRSGSAAHPASPIPFREIASHRGAVELVGSATFLASVTIDDDGLRREVRLSRGDGPIVRTIAGELAGVANGFAFVLARGDVGLEVLRVGLDGDPVVVGRVPAPDEFERIEATVAGDGSVVLETGDTVRVVDDQGVRALVTLADGEHVWDLVGDPTAPRAFLVVHRWATDDPVALPVQTRLILLDVSTGAVVWESVRPDSLGHGTGVSTFLPDGRVVTYLGGAVVVIDAAGVDTTLWPVAELEHDVVIAPDARRLAYTDQRGTGDGSWIDPTCVIEYVDEPIARAKGSRRVTAYKGLCSQGSGLAFVGAELWIAPHR